MRTAGFIMATEYVKHWNEAADDQSANIYDLRDQIDRAIITAAEICDRFDGLNSHRFHIVESMLIEAGVLTTEYGKQGGRTGQLRDRIFDIGNQMFAKMEATESYTDDDEIRQMFNADFFRFVIDPMSE